MVFFKGYPLFMKLGGSYFYSDGMELRQMEKKLGSQQNGHLTVMVIKH